MFKKPTVFVVGAGASKEAGLPIGSELAAKISEKMDIRFGHFGEKHEGRGDLPLFTNLRMAFPKEANEYQQAGWIIRDGIHLARSIDDFLDIHNHDERIMRYGKAAIAKTILEAEAASKLFVDLKNSNARMDMSRLSDTWFAKFMKMLGPGIRKNNLDGIFENVSFVVFNYDRCIEQFLTHGLMALYSIDQEHASRLVETLTIVHPYGSVGKLPGGFARGGVPFGSGSQDYVTMADGIKTYTEQVDDGEELRLVKCVYGDAETIVFLGFAFHEQNVSMLQPSSNMQPKKIFATAKGMSGSDIAVVKRGLISMFAKAKQPMLEQYIQIMGGLSCAELFDDYARSLPN